MSHKGAPLVASTLTRKCVFCNKPLLWIAMSDAIVVDYLFRAADADAISQSVPNGFWPLGYWHLGCMRPFDRFRKLWTAKFLDNFLNCRNYEIISDQQGALVIYSKNTATNGFIVDDGIFIFLTDAEIKNLLFDGQNYVHHHRNDQSWDAIPEEGLSEVRTRLRQHAHIPMSLLAKIFEISSDAIDLKTLDTAKLSVLDRTEKWLKQNVLCGRVESTFALPAGINGFIGQVRAVLGDSSPDITRRF